MLRDNVQAALDSYYADALGAAEAGFAPYLHELSAPFLLNVSQAYLDAPVRVMFVGKETNGWYDKLGVFYDRPDMIDVVKARYKDQSLRGTGRSGFLRQWDQFAQVFAGGDRSGICWNNLMKMDWHRPKRGYSRTSIHHSTHLFDFSVAACRFEIDLLKPDLIVFGCGHGYDRAVKAVLPEREFVYGEPKRLWHFTSNGIHCFRTFHPDAWDRHAPRPIKEYYKDIVAMASAVYGHRLPTAVAAV